MEKSKNEEFLEKYIVEKNRVKQLSMLKDYMLSLSLEELLAFNKEQFDYLKKAIKNPNISDEVKKGIFNTMDEMEFLLKGKIAA